MTTFEGTRAAASRLNAATGRQADLLRDGAEQQAQMIRQAADRQEQTARAAQSQVQGLGLRTADVVFNNDMRAGAAKAQAENAIGELLNNLGTTFAVTAQRVFEAQADANIAEQKREFRTAGSVAGMTGAPRDPNAPRAYQDAFSESAATVAAEASVTRFAQEILPNLTDPQEIRDAAHRYAAEEIKGMDDPAYREYFVNGLLKSAIPMSRKHEANVVQAAQVRAQETAVGAVLAKLPSLQNETELLDAIQTAEAVYQPAERPTARADIVRRVMERAGENNETGRMLTLMTKLGWDVQFPEAVKGFYNEARVEAQAARKQNFETWQASKTETISRIEANIDTPDQTLVSDLGGLLGELKTLDQQGYSSQEGFQTTFKKALDLQAKLEKNAPAAASYMRHRAGYGGFDPKVHADYANKEAIGLLGMLDQASASGDPQAAAAARAQLKTFLSNMNGYLPEALATRVSGVFDNMDPTKIADPEQRQREISVRAGTLSVMLDAARGNPAILYDLKDKVPPEQAVFFRMAYKKVFAEGLSPEQALGQIYQQYPSEVRSRMAAFDTEKAYSRFATRAGGNNDAYGDMDDAMEDLGLTDPTLRSRFRQDVADAVRMYSDGRSTDALPYTAVEKAIEDTMKVYEAGSVQLPVMDADGDVVMGTVLLPDQGTRSLHRGGHLGQSAGELYQGWFEDFHESAERLQIGKYLGSPDGLPFDNDQLAIRPIMNGDGSFTVVSPTGPVQIPILDAQDETVLESLNADLKSKKAPVEFALAAGGTIAELRVRMDSNILAADRTEAMKQQALREYRRQFPIKYGFDGGNTDENPDTFQTGFTPSLLERMKGSFARDEQERQAAGEAISSKVPYLELFDGFLKIGSPPVEGGEGQSEVGGSQGDDTLSFRTNGDLADTYRTEALNEMAREAVSALQNEGLVSKALGLSKSIPEFQVFNDVLSYLDNIVEDYQMKSNAGIPMDPKSVPTDQGYRAARSQAMREHEGYKETVYIDTEGHPTVGIGINLDAPGNQRFLQKIGIDYRDVVSGKKKLSKDQLDILFDFNMAEAEKIVSSRIKVPLTPNQRVSLVSLAFNNPGLLGPNLVGYVNSKKWREAEEEIRKRSNLKKHRGLQNRRNREADQFAMDTHEPDRAFYHT